MNLGKMYSWKFDTQPFKEEMLNCSMRGTKYQTYASTKNKLFILGGQGGGGLDSKFLVIIMFSITCTSHYLLQNYCIF